MVLDELEVPIVLAPLAGGPATVELAAAVCEAGGLGFLAAGYLTPDRVEDQVAQLRERTARPFGVNLFVPSPAPADPAAIAAYGERLAAAGHPLGEARYEDDAFDAKVALLLATPPAVVSFTFGLPPAAVVAALQAQGSAVWVTVTTPAEGEAAAAAGADALIAQGLEAGGHRGGLHDDGEDLALLPLLQLLRARTDMPLVAAGGIATAAAVRAALAAGAHAAAAGTAFLRCPEAGTNPAHRAALATDTPTRLTRAFSGRTARGLVNDFMERHDGYAPAAYPEVHHLTSPLRAAARERGDAGGFNLWAGQAHALARAEPAAAVVARLAGAV